LLCQLKISMNQSAALLSQRNLKSINSWQFHIRASVLPYF